MNLIHVMDWDIIAPIVQGNTFYHLILLYILLWDKNVSKRDY
jgi:hypothetical protein